MVDRDCVARIHRAYAVAMALPSPRPQAGWKKAERREKREESREKMAAPSMQSIFTGPKKARVRPQNGEAQGRVDWKRDGGPDAKIEGARAKCDL